MSIFAQLSTVREPLHLSCYFSTILDLPTERAYPVRYCKSMFRAVVLEDAMNRLRNYLTTTAAAVKFVAVLSIIMGFASNASAELEVIAPQYSNGDYTVTFSGCSNVPDMVYCRLEERVGQSGSWSNTDGNFTNKALGEYFYRAHEYIFSETIVNGEPIPNFQHIYSDEKRVIVTSQQIPVPDTVEVQRQYTYDVKIGDLNGNNRQDIYISRTLGGAVGDGTLDNFFLMQNFDGSFSPNAGSPADHLLADLWMTSAIQPVLEDINLDGFVDIYVDGLDAYIANAEPQLTFAPAQVFDQNPSGVLEFGPETLGFFDDLGDYYLDPNYFEDNATTVNVPGYWHDTVSCIWFYSFWEQRWIFSCEVVSEWVPGYSYLDYSAFNPNAIAVWSVIKDILDNGIGSWKDVIDILEGVIGVVFGQGICVDYGFGMSTDTCNGLQMYLLVARSQNAITKPRTPGYIWITGRFAVSEYVNVWWKHTALEYVYPATKINVVFSAIPISDPYVNNGTTYLNAQIGYTPDLPNEMMTLGQVDMSILGGTDPLVQATAALALLSTAHGNYDDETLEYEAMPDPGDDKYNSNSYVHGMALAIGGIPIFDDPAYDISDLPGWEKPVPSQYFQQ